MTYVLSLITSVLLFVGLVGVPVDPIIDPVMFLIMFVLVNLTYLIIGSAFK